MTEIEVPSGVAIIESSAFENCENLVSITIPDSVTNIAESSFKNCDKLTIYGSVTSFAKEYADDCDIPFVEK